VHVPHAPIERFRSAKFTHVPVRSPVHAQPVAPTSQRRDETHTRPAPQSALELHPAGGAAGTVHASPVTHVFEHTSPEQHAPVGHARHAFWERHMPQRTFVWSHPPAAAVVAAGHCVSSPSQHGWSSGTHGAPQWCDPGGQSTLPTVPAAPQQNWPVQPRVALRKQPALPSQYALVLPVPSSQQTASTGRQPVPHGAVPGAQ
jgi:hypothetical protein